MHIVYCMRCHPVHEALAPSAANVVKLIELIFSLHRVLVRSAKPGPAQSIKLSEDLMSANLHFGLKESTFLWTM